MRYCATASARAALALVRCVKEGRWPQDGPILAQALLTVIAPQGENDRPLSRDKCAA
jgi:hypothetical protein